MKQDENKLRLWQDRLQAAENAIEGERARMKKREKLYEGDHTIYGAGGRAQAARTASARPPTCGTCALRWWRRRWTAPSPAPR